MKHLLDANKNKRGLTLVELLVAGTITALMLSCLCGIYFAISRQWNRQQGEGDALLSTSRACSTLADYVSKSMGAAVLTRFSNGDTLAVNLPSTTAYGNLYVPTWSANKIQYISGNWVIFYLSDTTGSYSKSGNILWAATMSWVNFPNSVVPDKSWSMYYDTKNGKIAPLKSICFTYSDSGNQPIVVVKVISSYKNGQTESQLSQSRTICLRNSN